MGRVQTRKSQGVEVRKTIAVCVVLTPGCAVIPDAVRLETVHESHLVQHAFFTQHSAHYGKDGVDLVLKWNRGGVVADVSEGYSFHGNDGSPAPREWFEARVGYEWRVK
jgi:hypothetical protein